MYHKLLTQWFIWIAIGSFGALPSFCHAQANRNATHDFYNSNMPPGAIGRMQFQSQFPSSGYTQPFKLIVPKGCVISQAVPSGFGTASASPFVVGLQVSEAYRFKISDIPLMGNLALYPTIEVIDRLHPPAGQKWKYPVPVEFSIEDLKLAAQGNLVTRVVYLEQPREALAGPATPAEEQPYFDVGPKEDPLKVADYLGRAIAVVHIGSRQPDPNGDDDFYLYSPPVEAAGMSFAPKRQGLFSVSPVGFDAPIPTRPASRESFEDRFGRGPRQRKTAPGKVPAFNLTPSDLQSAIGP